GTRRKGASAAWRTTFGKTLQPVHARFGSGYSVANLKNFRAFYLTSSEPLTAIRYPLGGEFTPRITQGKAQGVMPAHGNPRERAAGGIFAAVHPPSERQVERHRGGHRTAVCLSRPFGTPALRPLTARAIPRGSC